MAIYDIDSLPSSFKEGDIINCPYSGTIKSITLPKGKYKFELWGAGVNPLGHSGSVGNGITKYKMGGYTVGNFVVSDTSKTLYLVSGGAGTHIVSSGYNGGGIHKSLQFNGATSTLLGMVGKSTNGGGATHIAFVSGLLSEIGEDNLSEVVAVAGGCGGPGVSKTDTEVLPFLVAHFLIDNPSYGGGTTGLSPNLPMYYGFGGTQSEGGSGGRFIQGMVAGAGSFGQGGSGYDGAGFSYTHSTLGSITQYASGGGGGLYGGGGATHIFPDQNPAAAGTALASAGGGSGYISNYLEDAATYNPSDSTPDCPVEYDGYIRITVLSVGHQNTIIKANGTWEDCTPLIKVNNTWKDIDKMFVKVDGAWQLVINNVHPPIALPPKMPPEGTLLAQFYKATGFTTLKNSDDGIFKSGQDGGYFFYKILTDDTFALDLQIDFKSGVPNEAFYGLSIANDPTKYDASEFHGAYPLIHPDYDDYSGRVRKMIPGGNLNKYIVGYVDYDPDGYVEKGDFTILNSCYNGYIYM